MTTPRRKSWPDINSPFFPGNYLEIIIRVSDGRGFVGSVTVYRPNKFRDSRRVEKVAGLNAVVSLGYFFDAKHMEV